jgi:hypothetical protein
MSRPNGFSTMTRANVPSFSVDSPVAARCCRIARVRARRRRQVEDAVAGGAALAVDLLELLLQRRVAGAVAEVPGGT